MNSFGTHIDSTIHDNLSSNLLNLILISYSAGIDWLIHGELRKILKSGWNKARVEKVIAIKNNQKNKRSNISATRVQSLANSALFWGWGGTGRFSSTTGEGSTVDTWSSSRGTGSEVLLRTQTGSCSVSVDGFDDTIRGGRISTSPFPLIVVGDVRYISTVPDDVFRLIFWDFINALDFEIFWYAFAVSHIPRSLAIQTRTRLLTQGGTGLSLIPYRFRTRTVRTIDIVVMASVHVRYMTEISQQKWIIFSSIRQHVRCI